MNGTKLCLLFHVLLCSIAFALPAFATPAPRVRFDTGTPPDVPPEVLIGENFTFRVRFRNDPSGTVGFGPFIDVVLDAGGANISKPCPCDGITFDPVVGANMISVNGGPVPLVAHVSQAPCASSPSPFTLVHPFHGVNAVQVRPGAQLVTIELPFGSFDPTQPEVVVEISAHVSNLADAGHFLAISARGGFRYGADALDNAPPDWPVLSDLVTGTPPNDQQTDSGQWSAQAQTTPTVIIISKKYLGPEDETATGPNFLQQYQLSIDVAAGQTLTNVIFTDHLPNNLAFHQVVSSTPGWFANIPVPGAAHNAPNNDLVFHSASVTGVAGPDATFVFDFFIPELDANGQPVLSPSSCAFVLSNDDIVASGDWTPIDPCDTAPVHIISDVTPVDHALSDKCLAIQKSVTDLNGTSSAHPIPGDTLRYTLQFELSDFKTADNLKVSDILSDGQTIVPGSLTLTVTDQCGTTTGNIPPVAITQTLIGCGPPTALSKRTQLDIDVSLAMALLAGPPRHVARIMTGGHALGTPTTVPAIGTIQFSARIDDVYQCLAPPHQFVDKDDPIRDDVTITGDILKNDTSCTTVSPTPAGFAATDDSHVAFSIASDALAKSVYAVFRGSVQICGPTSPCPAKPQVIPGDLVVFRLTKTIPSTDAENLVIQDWLPLPLFLVAGSTFSNTVCGIPNVGAACILPTNTIPVVPTYTADATTNSFQLTYGTFNNPSNQASTIDVLFSRIVTNAPFADGLYITNEAQERETNSFGLEFDQNAIAQVQAREPALKITKGVVRADNPNAVFSPYPPGPVTFGSTGCPRFTGAITSANLASTPISSDVANVDANDCLTFAIVVENTGGAAAYNVALREIFPLGPTDGPECFNADFSNICVRYGDGTPLNFTLGIGRSLPITLLDPLQPSNTSGSNIAVITFDACLFSNINPGCCPNSTSLQSYTSTSPAGAPNFVDAGFAGPFQDTAQVCVLPKATKSITSTSETSTAGTHVTVGEIIRYHVDLIVPETTSPISYTLQDLLPAGLQYLGNPIVTSVSGGVTVTNNPPHVSGATATCSGGNVIFDFGPVVNPNNTPAQEIVSLEFNVLVCNVATNHDGTLLDNSLTVLANGQPIASSNAAQVVVVEPNLVIAKHGSASSLTAGVTATYTITLTNNGTASAFDVHLTDALPSCLTNLTNVQVSTTATNASTTTTLDLAIASIPPGGSITVQYSATLTCVDCNKLTNTAKVTWTSLPGPAGTTSNPTGSATPGASGLSNGERDGSGGVNDYVAAAQATLCCVLVSNETLSSNPNGTFTDTFTVTNFTPFTIGTINFFPSASNVTIAPSSFAGLVSPGGSQTVTVTISGSGAVSGANVCFTVELANAGPLCIVDHCVTLPNGCAQPPSGLVAWWPLDEKGLGTVVHDIAGNHNGSVPGPGFHSAPGKVNGALGFCTIGAPLQVTVHDSSDLNFGPTQSFSIDAWIWPAGGFPMVVDKLNWPNPSAGYRFYIDNTRRLKLDIAGGAFFGITVLPTGVWQHVAVTVDRPGQKVTFYINGVPEVVGSSSSFLNAASPGIDLLIGGTHESQLTACEYLVDEVEIFNGVLAPSDVQAIYSAGSVGKCAPGLLCVVNFEDLNRNGVRDPGEPLLTGWSFNVFDPSGNLVGTIDANTSPACLAVSHPGTYTVVEHVVNRWTPTTPSTQSVVVTAGQTTNVTFGNRSSRWPHAVR